MKFLTSWTTDAQYAYNRLRFVLTVPFVYSHSATDLTIRYCPTFNRLVIFGTLTPPAKPIYNPYIIRDEEEIKSRLQ